MCNFYSLSKGQAAIREIASVWTDRTGNLAPQPAVFPDQPGPVVRMGDEGRELKEGDVEADLFGFLTTEANAVVVAVHPKAMPVILTEPEEWEAWLTGPIDEIEALQRPLPRHVLEIVAEGKRQDPASSATYGTG